MEKQGNTAAPPEYDASGAPHSAPPTQSAYPPQAPPGAYPPQGPPPQGYPAQGPPPQGYPAQGPPPQGYPAQGPPPQGYPPQGYPQYAYPTATGVTVGPVATTVVVASHGVLGLNPSNMECPHCHAQIVTQLSYEVGLFAWMIVGILFLFGLWLCCFIPLCVNDCKDVVHSCPNCKRVLGRRNRLS